MLVGRKIRERRKELKLTLQELAERTTLSVGFLSQVERNQATPSLSSVINIVQALGLSVDDLVRAPAGAGNVTRARDRDEFHIDGSDVTYARLSASFEDHRFNAVEVNLPPGYEAESLIHDGEEFIYVLEGEISMSLDGVEHHLGPGDTIHFPSSIRHRWHNCTKRPARLIWAGSLDLFSSHRSGRLEEMIIKKAS